MGRVHLLLPGTALCCYVYVYNEVVSELVESDTGDVSLGPRLPLISVGCQCHQEALTVKKQQLVGALALRALLQ